MATLQKIRERSVLLLVAIGVALLGFVLTDAISNGSTLLNFSKNYAAKVDGNVISIADLENKAKVIGQMQNSGDDSYKTREGAWNELIRETVLENQYEKLGISVSDEEVLDMYTGDFISPVVARQFTNPQTGIFDKAAMENQLKIINYSEDMVSPEQVGQWHQMKNMFLIMEDIMVSERKQSKYMNLLSKSMYTTNFEAGLSLKEKENMYDFEYVYVPFSSIKNEDIELTQSQIKDFYNRNKESFKTEAKRTISYVRFPLAPSSEDHRAAKVQVNQIAKDFEKSEEDLDFIALNSDEKTRIVYQSKSETPENIQEVAFSEPVGSVLTPAFENATNTWSIVKIHDKKMLPDSVRIGILVVAPVEGDNQETFNSRVDSLFKVVESTNDINTLASISASKSPTGDLDYGWFKQGSVPDSCFFGGNNDVYKLYQQNSVSIIKVLDQSKRVEKVGLAVVKKSVNFSQETQRNIYNQALTFLNKVEENIEFDSLASQQNLYYRSATFLENEYKIEGLGNSRELIKWANGSKEGELSSVMELNDQFVVAVVTGITEKGYIPIDKAEGSIKVALLKKERTKLCKEQVAGAVKDASSLSNVATKLNQSIDRASNFQTSSSVLNAIGNEPNLATAAAFASEGKIVGPIVGNAGVFAINVTQKTRNSQVQGNLTQEKRVSDMMRKYFVEQAAYGELEKKSEIVDNRSRFY